MVWLLPQASLSSTKQGISFVREADSMSFTGTAEVITKKDMPKRFRKDSSSTTIRMKWMVKTTVSSSFPLRRLYSGLTVILPSSHSDPVASIPSASNVFFATIL